MPPIPPHLRHLFKPAAPAPAAAAVPKPVKVAYVKSQGQTRSHHCHGRMPGCKGQCPPAKWGCTSCWFKLPKFLRDKVWAAYVPGQEVNMTPSRHYVAVAREVQAWIAANYPGSVEDPHATPGYDAPAPPPTIIDGGMFWTEQERAAAAANVPAMRAAAIAHLRSRGVPPDRTQVGGCACPVCGHPAGLVYHRCGLTGKVWARCRVNHCSNWSE